MRTKTKEECEGHYMKNFINNPLFSSTLLSLRQVEEARTADTAIPFKRKRPASVSSLKQLITQYSYFQTANNCLLSKDLWKSLNDCSLLFDCCFHKLLFSFLTFPCILETSEIMQIAHIKSHTKFFSSATDDPPRPSFDSQLSRDMAGYMPARADFMEVSAVFFLYTGIVFLLVFFFFANDPNIQ